MIGAQQHIGAPGVLAALDKVGKIENGLKAFAAQVFQQKLASVRRIAEDALFVFVQQHDVLAFCIFNHPGKPLQHSVCIGVGLPALGGIKAEQADKRRVQPLRDLHRAPEQLPMRREILFNAYFADGRAHGRKPHVGCGKLLPDVGKLAVRAAHKAFSVHAAHFNVMHIQFLQHFQLAVQRGVNLIGKAAEQKVF